jgi:lysyl-tRNA synthetase class II
MRIDEFHASYDNKIKEKSTFLEEESIALSGRVMSIRAAGSKLIFLDLHGDD